MPYISDYNVMQVKIDNKTKALIDAGFSPVEDESLVFDTMQQEKFNLEDELFE